MSNPLLEQQELPPFSRIEPHHVEPAIRQLIERNQQGIDELLTSNEHYSWDNLLQPIEDMEDELAKAWSPVSHLNSVRNNDELREAYNACLPLLSEYSTWMGQHSATVRRLPTDRRPRGFFFPERLLRARPSNMPCGISAWLACRCRQEKKQEVRRAA